MTTRIRVQTDQGIVAINLPELGRWLNAPGAWVWVDVQGDPDQAEQILRDVFQFHPLIVRDSLDDARHPRVHGFPGYLYLVVHGVRVSDPSPDDQDTQPPPPSSAATSNEIRVRSVIPGEFCTVELDVFLGDRFLVTFHRERLDALEAIYRNTLLPDSTGMGNGPSSLLREVLDQLVDQYNPILDRFDAELTVLEDSILAYPLPEHLAALLKIKRGLQYLRRINTHQQGTILRLGRGEFPQIPEGERPFYRDVADRLARISDLAETYREVAGALLSTHLSVSSNRLNEVMRTLTFVSLLLMPPTLIAGVYGMNFKHMPELKLQYGYGGSLLLMALSMAGGAWFMKKRGLIG